VHFSPRYFPQNMTSGQAKHKAGSKQAGRQLVAWSRQQETGSQQLVPVAGKLAARNR
jgi:hypothetical protein